MRPPGPPLPDRELLHALVPSHHPAIRGDNRAGSILRRTILANEASMVLVGNEANLLAIGLFGHVVQAEAVGNPANFLLLVIAHREIAAGREPQADSPQHIRLVLARIEAPAQGEAAVGRLHQPGVVPRGNLPAPTLSA